MVHLHPGPAINLHSQHSKVLVLSLLGRDLKKPWRCLSCEDKFRQPNPASGRQEEEEEEEEEGEMHGQVFFYFFSVVTLEQTLKAEITKGQSE